MVNQGERFLDMRQGCIIHLVQRHLAGSMVVVIVSGGNVIQDFSGVVMLRYAF